MCGRYVFKPTEQLNKYYDYSFKENYNISPGTIVPLLDSNQKVISRIWGIKPLWNNSIQLINAKLETYKYKNTFKNLKRCVFFSNGYYEWKKIEKKSTPFFHFIEEEFFFFAGLHNEKECCILTKTNTINNYNVHSRQPVCLTYDLTDEWLKNSNLLELKKKLNFHQVSSLVNSPRNNNEKLIENIKKNN